MKFEEFLNDKEIYSEGTDSPSPLISVILPTYNRAGEGLLEPCINSVLGQNFTDFELIIIDDGSTDDTDEIIRRYSSRDTRIIGVRHDRNSGLPALRVDEGILLSRGRYIAFIFDDNTWELNALETLLGQIKKSQADMVFGLMRFSQSESTTQLLGDLPLTIELLQNGNYIPNGAVLCARIFFDKFGMYDPHLGIRRICDWDLWQRAMRLGARIDQVPKIIGLENGRISPQSLGNTVRLDYKISTAYIQDERQLVLRTEKLKPSAILNYDVFDPESIVRYVRDLSEWDTFENLVYRPYFEEKPDIIPEYLVRHNRRFDAETNGYALNSANPLFKDRKRILIVANRITRIVRDWLAALQLERNFILLTTSQQNSSAFLPSDLDFVILFDCSSTRLIPFISACQEVGAPVINIIEHGMDSVFTGDYDPLRKLDFNRHKDLAFQTKPPTYYSHPGVPFSNNANVSDITSAVDLVLHIGDSNRQLGGNLRLDFYPNAPVDWQEQAVALPTIAFYIGDADSVGSNLFEKFEQILTSIDPGWKREIYGVSNTTLPNAINFHGNVTFLLTSETLPTLIHQSENRIWIVPDIILTRYSSYHQSIMREDAVRTGGFLVNESIFINFPDSPFTLGELVTEHRNAQIDRGESFRCDARYLHYLNIVLGTMLAKKIADWRGEDKARDIKSLVMINSQLLGGSEIYGLLMANVLRNIGINIKVAFPKYDQYHSGTEKIQSWLQDHNMPAAIELDYGQASIALHSQFLIEAEVEKAAHNLTKSVADLGIGMIFCSGFIAEPIIAPDENRLLYQALFPPWGYALNKLTFARGRVDGIVSDSQWAAKIWGEWLNPPIACVPSLIEKQYFKILNQNLSPEPVQIAVVGTLIHLKRQKEVMLAIGKLLEEGFNLQLNVYGHALDIFNDYVRELKEISNLPIYQGRIKLHGFVPDSTEITAGNHLIISASGDESIPQGLIFNMAGGLIPIACPAGGIEEVVIENETGFLVNGYSVENITDSLRKALQSRDRWPEIQLRGRRLLVENCSEQEFTHRLLRMMNEGADIRFSEGASIRSEAYAGMNKSLQTGKKQKGITVNPPAHAIQIQRPASLVGKLFEIGLDINSAPLVYKLSCTVDNFCGIRLSFGTYMSHPRGELQISIRSAEGRNLLRLIELPIEGLMDNTWYRIDFDPIHNAKGENFFVSISGRLRTGRLGLYEVASHGSNNRRRIRKVVQAVHRIIPIRLTQTGAAVFPFEDDNRSSEQNQVETR